MNSSHGPVGSSYVPVSPRALAAVFLSVVALWALTLCLIPPSGNFPLNDDWIYARAVKDWMETGRYTGHPFASASLVGQACWGRAFCNVFGFSFVALRWSTLVLWLAAALAASRAALVLRAAPFTAALAGALVIANPIAMNLGYTFMTDVPFLAACALAGHFFLRALAEPRWSVILAGSLFAAWGFLIRQFALLLPVAFLVAMAPLLYRLGRRESVRLLLPAALPFGAAWGMLQYLNGQSDKLTHPWKPDVLGGSALECVAGAMKFDGVAMVYLGLFAAPLVAAAAWFWLWHREGSTARRSWGLLAATLIVAATVCWSPPRRIPFIGNLIYDTGVGPLTVKGAALNGGAWRPVAIGEGWWIPTLLGIFAAAWMLAGWLRWFILIPGDGRRPVRDPRRRQQVFLMLWAGFMIGALYQPWLPVRFDRYFLGALIPVLLLIVASPRMRSPAFIATQIGLTAALYSFSLVSLQDYLAWNTARWETVRRLMADGVPPEEIDAGYEFNGWYTSRPFIERDGPWAFYQSGKLGWWAVGDTWALSWRPRDGFETAESVPYHSWLAGQDGRLLLLRRKAEESSSDRRSETEMRERPDTPRPPGTQTGETSR